MKHLFSSLISLGFASFGSLRSGRANFSRLSTLACVAISGVIFLPESSFGKTYSNRDLRKAGFSGTYRGTARGTVYQWDGFNMVYVPSAISAPGKQRVPARSRTVRGPNGNTFRLIFRKASGSKKRVTIRGRYSGLSFNNFYADTTTATGSYKLTLVKKGSGRRATVKGSVADRFSENASVGGGLYNRWVINGRNLR